MMFDTTTQHGFAPLGMPGHQPAPYGQQFGQPQNAGFVPIIGLVPQSLLVNLVAQCLQQAQLAGLTPQIGGSPLSALTPQGLFGHGPGQFGQLQPFGLPQQLGQLQPFGLPQQLGQLQPFGLPQQFGLPQYGQSQLWPSPSAAPGGWAGQPQYSGAVGRGIVTYAG
jgi:hypothetical protein